MACRSTQSYETEFCFLVAHWFCPRFLLFSPREGCRNVEWPISNNSIRFGNFMTILTHGKMQLRCKPAVGYGWLAYSAPSKERSSDSDHAYLLIDILARMSNQCFRMHYWRPDMFVKVVLSSFLLHDHAGFTVPHWEIAAEQSPAVPPENAHEGPFRDQDREVSTGVFFLIEVLPGFMQTIDSKWGFGIAPCLQTYPCLSCRYGEHDKKENFTHRNFLLANSAFLLKRSSLLDSIRI